MSQQTFQSPIHLRVASHGCRLHGDCQLRRERMPRLRGHSRGRTVLRPLRLLLLL